jgi:hypothetical protein
MAAKQGAGPGAMIPFEALPGTELAIRRSGGNRSRYITGIDCDAAGSAA